MQGSPKIDSRPSRRGKLRTFMVPIGIILFVLGFVVTLLVIQSDHESGAEVDDSLSGAEGSHTAPPPGLVLISGIVMSLTGVVLATVGPAAELVRRKS